MATLWLKKPRSEKSFGLSNSAKTFQIASLAAKTKTNQFFVHLHPLATRLPHAFPSPTFTTLPTSLLLASIGPFNAFRLSEWRLLRFIFFHFPHNYGKEIYGKKNTLQRLQMNFPGLCDFSRPTEKEKHQVLKI